VDGVVEEHAPVRFAADVPARGTFDEWLAEQDADTVPSAYRRRIIPILPSAPDWTSSRILIFCGSQRIWKARLNQTPVFSTAWMMRSQSVSEVAIGF
jgi:hypothetical protein